MHIMKYSASLLGTALVGALIGFAGAPLVAQAAEGDASYRAELLPLNAMTTGAEAGGEATFVISGDQLTIRVTAKGVPPNMEHLQHFHGFAMGDQKSACPVAGSDVNGDGVIDIKETEALAGETMVPFQDDPVSMQIVSDTYPKADGGGSYTYEKTVPLKALEDAFTGKYPGQKLDLERRVVFLHGVPATTKLAPSVASLGDIPAQVTIPIACGVIEKSAN
jgi:hypothetical protein